MNMLLSMKTIYNGPDLVTIVPQNLLAETATALKCCHGKQRTVEFHRSRHPLLSALHAQCSITPVPSTNQSERNHRVRAWDLSGLSQVAHETTCRQIPAIGQCCTREHYTFLRRRWVSHRRGNSVCQSYRLQQHTCWGERHR